MVECDTVLFSVGLVPENELTRKAGIAMDTITNGPKVDQYMQIALSKKKSIMMGIVLNANDLTVY